MRLPLSLAPVEAKPVDVIACGENSVDLIGVLGAAGSTLAPGSKNVLHSLRIRPGGQAASAAIGCARQGWRTRYVGACGDDAHGAIVKTSLVGSGVHLAIAERPGVATRAALILVDAESGERTVFEYRDARLALSAAEIAAASIGDARILLVDGTDPDAAHAAARAARQAGVPVVIDLDVLNDRALELLRLVDIAVVPESFASAYAGTTDAGRAARTMHERTGASLAVVTLGSHGSVAWCGGRQFTTAPFAVAAVDTTGAGDAFRAGLMSGWLRLGNGASIETVLAYANALAACSCLAEGAQDGLVDRTVLDRFVTDAGRPWSN